MDMVINRHTVKSLRTQKLWSQDELATACGVGLRTIQRVEGEGQASPETVKALAAVFQIDSSELLISKTDTHTYLNVQLGYTIIGVIILVATFLIYLLNSTQIGINEFQLAMVLLATSILMFATLTTQVTNDEVKLHMGLGIIRKTVKLTDINSHSKVRNKAWWGIGVRLIPNGWLYNVSGLNAVELKLANGRIVRIGSDEVDAFNQAIHDAKIRLPDTVKND